MKTTLSTPKNILITGASSGIGAALALHYARDGVFLALSGRDEERLEEVGNACKARGAAVDMAVLDVGDRGHMEDWVHAADDEYPLDLVIANAGISGGTGGSMIGEPVEQARRIFDVNVMGVLNTIEPILPRMTQRGRGQVALMSSLASFRAMPGAPAYSASKAAVRLYGEALRISLEGSGVAVNVICPGFVESRITAANDFPMPFMMTGEKAAERIVRGLAKNQGLVAFPFPTVAGAKFLSMLPDFLALPLIRKLPSKPQS